MNEEYFTEHPWSGDNGSHEDWEKVLVSAGARQCEWARSLAGRERSDARAVRWGAQSAQRGAKRAERLFTCRSLSLRK